MTLRFHVAIAALAFATSASAQSNESGSAPYIAGGFTYIMPQDITSQSVRARLDDGFGGTLAIGRRLGPVRAEIEGGYREADVDSASGFGLNAAGTGRLSALSAMVNVFIDPAFRLGPFQPYIGGGAGIARFRARNVSAVGLPVLPPVTQIGGIDASTTGFAYQGMAGLGVATGDSGAITIGYRYFATPSVTTNVPLLGSVRISGLKTHGVEAGFRMNF
jgi:opacity protein-like surface antigen